MESLKIIVLCVLAAIVYGICQDMITTRVCLEYFTVGHPPIFGGTQNPTLLALGWGVIATWWVGVGLGVPAAFLARIGSRPMLTWRSLRWPILVLMVLVGISAVLAGISSYVTSGLNQYYFPEKSIISGVSRERAHLFAADFAAHTTAYAVGAVGGVLIWGWIWWRRASLERRAMLAEMDRLRQENEELIKRLSNNSLS